MFATYKRGTASKKRGFTLIELLVVIAIIGLLASIIIASLDQARKKGRDARRIADLKEIQQALELYYDASSTYPVLGNSTQVTASVPAGLTPTYISIIPTDPLNTGSNVYLYQSLNSNGTTACSTAPCPGYVLSSVTEGTPPTGSWTGTITGGTSNITCTAGTNYCVHN